MLWKCIVRTKKHSHDINSLCWYVLTAVKWQISGTHFEYPHSTIKTKNREIVYNSDPYITPPATALMIPKVLWWYVYSKYHIRYTHKYYILISHKEWPGRFDPAELTRGQVDSGAELVSGRLDPLPWNVRPWEILLLWRFSPGTCRPLDISVPWNFDTLDLSFLGHLITETFRFPVISVPDHFGPLYIRTWTFRS